MNRETNSIEQGNRLIHIWLGKSYETDKKVKELKYHSSWDWLKPVVDQIMTYSIAHREETLPLRSMSIFVGIEPCWRACVRFIEWYNKEQSVQASVATGGEQGTKS